MKYMNISTHNRCLRFNTGTRKKINWTFVCCQICWKDENNEKTAGNGPFLKSKCTLVQLSCKHTFQMDHCQPWTDDQSTMSLLQKRIGQLIHPYTKIGKCKLKFGFHFSRKKVREARPIAGSIQFEENFSNNFCAFLNHLPRAKTHKEIFFAP